MDFLRVTGMFVAAALAEVGGAYSLWQWLREGKSAFYGFLGLAALSLYGLIQTRQPFTFGRAFAAYGGVFISYGNVVGLVGRWPCARPLRLAGRRHLSCGRSRHIVGTPTLAIPRWSTVGWKTEGLAILASRTACESTPGAGSVQLSPRNISPIVRVRQREGPHLESLHAQPAPRHGSASVDRSPGRGTHPRTSCHLECLTSPQNKIRISASPNIDRGRCGKAFAIRTTRQHLPGAWQSQATRNHRLPARR